MKYILYTSYTCYVTYCLASQNKNTPTTTKKNYKLLSKSSLPRHVVGTQLPRQQRGFLQVRPQLHRNRRLDLLVEPLRLLLLPPPATSLRRKPHINISHGGRVALESRNDNIDRVSSCVSNSLPFWSTSCLASFYKKSPCIAGTSDNRGRTFPCANATSLT